MATPRARRRDRQRDAILRAAARLFRDRGFAETGMRDIADAADLSAANLYHYFDGKHDLLFYCQDRALDRMLAAVETARRTSASAAERLRLVSTAHLRTLLDDIEGATAHLQTEALPPRLPPPAEPAGDGAGLGGDLAHDASAGHPARPSGPASRGWLTAQDLFGGSSWGAPEATAAPLPSAGRAAAPVSAAALRATVRSTVFTSNGVRPGCLPRSRATSPVM